MVDCLRCIHVSEDFKQSLWFRRKHMFIKAPGEAVSTCRCKGPNCESIERTYDYVIASHSLQGKIKNWKWWKISNQGQTKRLLSWWKEVRNSRFGRSNQWPGHSGRKLPGRDKVENNSRRKRRGEKSKDGERADKCGRRAKGNRRS